MRKLSAGDVFAGFEIVSQLGGGAEGAVYRARDPRLDRPLALKLWHEPSQPRPGERLARLRHPNIVTVYAAGEDEGTAYLALEYVAGETLRARLSRGPLAARAVARCGGEIARALAAAHALELVHGDLKPDNVLLASDGGLRVIDFAVAWRGTPAYLSPERRAGGEASVADDLWALGVLLCELLTGRRPPLGVSGTDATAKLQAAAEQATFEGRERAATTSLLSLASSCLDANPDQRGSAESLAPRLEAIARGETEQDLQPFVGLTAYQRRDAPFFFGRREIIERCQARVGRDGLLVLTGPSAAGKTSLLQAGLLPQLARRTAITVLELDDRGPPIDSLAKQLASLDPLASAAPQQAAEGLAALLAETPSLLGPIVAQIAAARGERLVLLLDHLERWPNDPARDALLTALVEAAAPEPSAPLVLIALRDEALPRLLAHQALRECTSAVEVLPPPTRAQLLEVFSRPIERLGYRYEDDALVQQMVDEVVAEHAGLALSSFAAARLWQARDAEQRLLTRDAYEAFGGLAGALKRHAEAALSGLSAQATRCARAILVELTNAEGLRRAVATETLLAEVEAQDVGPRTLIEQTFEQLVRARLVVTFDAAEQPRCELVHEELLRRWDRLAGWVAKARARATLRAELEQAAELWAQRGEQPEELWQGAALAEARALLGDRHASPTIDRFVEAALRRADRARRRAWLRQAGLLLAVACLAALASLRWASRPPTPSPARGALHAAPRWARRMLADAWLAAERGAPAEARARLHALVAASHDAPSGVRGLWWKLATRPATTTATAPTTASQAVSTPTLQLRTSRGALRAIDNDIYVWRASSLQRILRCPAGKVQTLAVDAMGRRIAATSGRWLLLWDRRGRRLREIFPLAGEGRALAFTGAEQLRVATTRGEQRFALAHRPALEHGHRAAVIALAGGGDRRLHSLGASTLRRWSDDGRQQRVWRRLSGGRDLDRRGDRLLALGERGRRLVLFDATGSAGLWASDVDRPLRAARLAGPGALAIDVRGKLWRFVPPDAHPRPLATGHRGHVTAIAVSHDGQRYATAGADGRVILHDQQDQALGNVALGAPLGAIAFGAADTVVALDRRGRLHIIEGRRPTTTRHFPAPASLDRKRLGLLAWAGAGTVAVASGRTLWLRPLAPTAQETVEHCSTEITALATLPHAVAVGTRGGTVERFSPQGRPLGARVAAPAPDARFVFGGQHLHFAGRRFVVGVGALLATADAAALWVGYADGAVSRLPLDAKPRAHARIPASGSAVRALLQLSSEIVAVGHASGVLTLWQLSPGVLGASPARRLWQGKLHGALHTLRRRGTRLEAITSLGDRLVLDVELLLLPWRSFVTRVRRLPYRWEGAEDASRPGRLVWR